MKGLELSKQFYFEIGRPHLISVVPECEAVLAAGLVGKGSECLGFDDKFSQDHDFGPGFCIWLNDENFEHFGSALAKAYESLPETYLGMQVRKPGKNGDARVGVFRIEDFYAEFLGRLQPPRTLIEWMKVPEENFAAATNGCVFEDQCGEFSRIRGDLLAYYPEDVRRKKIGAKVALMAQSGQYNYARCMRRGEVTAARLALNEFTKSTISLLYLLNRRFTPFYKWSRRGVQYLPLLSEVGEKLDTISSHGLSKECWAEWDSPAYDNRLNTDDRNVRIIEDICSSIVGELKRQALTTVCSDYLQDHLYEIMAQIRDPALRALHVMIG